VTIPVLSQSSVLCATLLDGRSIEKCSAVQVVSSGRIYLSVNLAIIKTIDAVLEVHVTNESPRVNAYGVEHVSVSSNIVGFTLESVSAGSTLYFDVVALGF